MLLLSAHKRNSKWYMDKNVFHYNGSKVGVSETWFQVHYKKSWLLKNAVILYEKQPNTGLKESKFGLALVPGQTKDKILGLYKKYSWLNAVHFHVGSQGNPMKLFVQSAMVSLLHHLECNCWSPNMTFLFIGRLWWILSKNWNQYVAGKFTP